MALQIGRRMTLDSKGWKGVRDVVDPYSVPANYLLRARNVYLPEVGSGVGAYARPGFRLKNTAAQLATGGYGQAVQYATIEDGTVYNFFACGGKLYRSDASLLVFTDVTPAGITINATARVFITPFSNRIIVNDGVHTPWVGSSLAATPIIGTKIQYNNVGADWIAYGPAVIYQDSPFFVVKQRDGEGVDTGTPQKRIARVAWGFVDDPFTGYRQLNYDFEWDVIQNGANPIYALWSTNLAMYYFRNDSIGTFTGDVGPDLKTTANHDSIDQAIGTRAPASFAAFGNILYFLDELGRPHRFIVGKGLDPIWKQLRRVVPNTNSVFPAYTAYTACGQIVPELDLYLVAIYAPDVNVGTNQHATVLYAFDAATGKYVGDWTIAGGIAIHAMGTVVDSSGQKRLAIIGSKDVPSSPQVAGAGGYVWVLGLLADGKWTDGDDDTSVVPEISITAAPVPYQADTVYNIDRVVAIVSEQTGDTTPKTIAITPAEATINVGGQQQYVAVVRNAAGVILDLQPDIWTSSAPAKATIDDAGLATGVADGDTNITATLSLYGLVSNTAVLHVFDPELATSIEIAPDTATINVAETQQLVATVRNGHGDILVGYPIDSWVSDTPADASVDSDGLVTGVALGAAGITAHITTPALTSNTSTITVTDDSFVHTYATPGSNAFVVSSGSGNVDYLVVAGGGGGGSADGTGVGCGGGGAGGVRTGTHAVTPGSYSIQVGAGASPASAEAGVAPAVPGFDGGPSHFDTISCTGGGGGDAHNGGGHSGGSGGGGGTIGDHTGWPGGAGIGGEGDNGGNGVGDGASRGGGGGGASQVGSSIGDGAGGNGVASSISGVSVTYGGGGGGGPPGGLPVGGAGGTGGGGHGSDAATDATSGTANTGGGGGGGGGARFRDGGGGGSGIVIIRYKVSTLISATGGVKVRVS